MFLKSISVAFYNKGLFDKKKQNINNLNYQTNKFYPKKNLSFSGSLLEKMSSPVDTKTEDKQIKKSKIKRLLGWIGTIIAAGIAAISRLFKRSSNPAGSVKAVKKLIKTLKPDDVETAKKFYPVLMRNAEALNVKKEQFNTLMNVVKKENMPFMIEEGVDLISSKMTALKDCIVEPMEDLALLFKSLTQNNKKMFDFVSNNTEKVNIELAEDILLFLKLKPEKHEYILNSLLPKLIKNKKELNLKSANRFADILNKITPECEPLIEQIADFPIDKARNINKYSILSVVNENNKDCVIPLLQDLDKSNYTTAKLKKILSSATNKDAKAIITVSKHADTLKKLEIEQGKVQNLIKDEDTAKVFDFVMDRQDFFNILELADIEYCLKHLKADKLQYLSDDLISILKENRDLLNFRIPDMITDGLKNADSSILDIVKSVLQYAKTSPTLKNCDLEYSTIIGILNKDNIHKLPKLMQKIEQFDTENKSLLFIDDFKNLLDKIE